MQDSNSIQDSIQDSNDNRIDNIIVDISKLEELNKLDELVLMPIYPAREEPIHGISSDWLLSKLSLKNKSLKSPSEVLQHFSNYSEGVVLTIGAGDIDRIVKPLKEILTSNSSN